MLGSTRDLAGWHAVTPDGSCAHPHTGRLAAEQCAQEWLTAQMRVVRTIALGVRHRRPAQVRDEAVEAGLETLAACLASFEPASGVPWAPFLRQRLRWRLADDARAADWLPRGKRGVIPEETLPAWRRRPVPADFTDPALEKVLTRAVGGDPAVELADVAAAGEVIDAVAGLPDRLRFVLVETTLGERTQDSVAAELGVTGSRVSQLRKEAVAAVRARLGVSA